MREIRLNKSARGSQAGFTIIELVVVILLLGILTATALPRFIDVTDEAHDAVVDATRSGLQTGAALFRAAWFAGGQGNSAVTQFGDGTLKPDVSTGYPVGAPAGNAILTSAECLQIFVGLLQTGAPTSAAADYDATAATLEANIEAVSANVDFVVTEEATAANGCRFYYTGQFKEGTNAVGGSVDIPVLTYTVSTGAVVAATDFTMNQP